VTAVVYGALSGALFGAMAVAVRAALRHGGDATAGALAVAGVAAAVVAPFGLASGVHAGLGPRSLWPFALAGALVPGCSQILFIVAVRDAGPSRTAILIGTAPLMSVAIALVFLHEPFRPLLLAATVLVVAGGAVLVRERARPAHFRRVGAILALVCAGMFAVRDNVVRWAAKGADATPLAAAAVSLAAAALVVFAWVLVASRDRLGERLRVAVRPFAPAGITLAVAYVCLFEAFDSGRVSIVAPLNATQSLWAVVFSALVFGRAADVIGRRLFAAGLLIVAGAAIIGIVR
jgi:drug/metabolite transporter (DMT)-like permease